MLVSASTVQVDRSEQFNLKILALFGLIKMQLQPIKPRFSLNLEWRYLVQNIGSSYINICFYVRILLHLVIMMAVVHLKKVITFNVLTYETKLIMLLAPDIKTSMGNSYVCLSLVKCFWQTLFLSLAYNLKLESVWVLF